jgi:glycosyltransferase involved in cell wall biosynthesis
MTNFRKLVFLDPRGIINQTVDSLARHASYAEALSLRMQRMGYSASKALLLTTGTQRESELIESDCLPVKLVGKPRRFSLSFVMRAIGVLRKEENSPTLLIVGDPWESFLSGYAVKKFLKNETLIQTNIHADIFDEAWIKQKWMNRVRSLISWPAIKRSDSVRVVSEELAKTILVKYPRKHVLYAPIAMHQKARKVGGSGPYKSKPITFGWVGRIEPDRGAIEFVNLVRRLNGENDSFHIVIAGKGSLQEQFLSELKGITSEERVQYFGFLKQEDIGLVYEKMDLLLTFAKSESYGMAIREALLFGKPVLGVESKGLGRLQEKMGQEFVKSFDPNADIAEVKLVIKKLMSSTVPPSFTAKLLKLDQGYFESLIESWVYLLNPKGIGRN